MAVIRNSAFLNRYKLKKNPTFKDFLGAKFYFFPPVVDFLHYFLPLKFKFLTEFYVAVENNELIGLIGLQTTRGNSGKIKITNFFLEQNSFEMGEQLINYAILKYCARGASSFFVSIDEGLTQMQQLFLKNCNFRVCSKELLFNIDTDQKDYDATNFAVFKPFKSSKIKQLNSLHNDCVNAQYKYSFSKNAAEFKNEFINNSWGKISFKYVLENEEKNEVYGFASIATQDNSNYILECFLSPAFSAYFSDTINFAKMQISKRNKKYNLYLKLKNYYHNSKELREYAETKKFKLMQTNIILTKDFLNVAMEHSIIQNARIIFSDITPAFKGIRKSSGDGTF